jgi:Leucine-rich repeat (LRR) protein
LSLGYNRISDISALANLAELKILYLSANSLDNIAPLRNLINLKRLTLDNNLVDNINPLGGLPNLAHVSLLNNCINNFRSFAEPGIIAGMEYQHDLCSSPNLFRKVITQEWLDEQIGRQCEDYVQDSAKATHYDYNYCSDGLYYGIFIRNRDSDSFKRLVCHLPWDSDLGEFLRALETDADTTGSYRTYKYGNNVILYVQGDRIKCQSKKTRVSGGYEYELEAYMDIFKVRYEVERSELNGMEVLTARKNDHVVREIVGDEFHTLQFFEPGFYATEISKQQ